MLPQEWSDWIQEARRRREGVYRSDPDEVTANYDREIGHARDYHGREVLELIQNADDAGHGSGGNRLRFVLTSSGLCVGNTGTVFSPRGVKSLVVSDNSPKREDGSAFIGNRGLGFRSILNWSDSPFVLSGNLRIAFDQTKALEWFKSLMDDEGISARIQRRLDAGQPFPAAILGVPLDLPSDPDAARAFIESPGYASTFDLASDMRAAGFDTVIGVPFKNPSVVEEVQPQLGEISDEILLFLNNLELLEIGDQSWRVLSRASEEIVLQVDDARPNRWAVFRQAGEVPAELLRPDQRHAPDYEVRVAVSLGEEFDGGLYCYLPTEVRFPFRVVAHATVELTNNRQNLSETKANEFILSRLASAMADAAERWATIDEPWTHLEMVAAGGDLDPLLEDYRFEQELVAALRTKQIVPCRDHRLRRPGEARRFDHDPSNWLPMEAFEDLSLFTRSRPIRRLLDELEVPALQESELGERLECISPRLALDERAKLLASLVERRILPAQAPSLLVAADGTVIDASATVFLPPQGDREFELPDWMDLRFLDPALMHLMYSELKVQRSEELRSKLSAYRIRPYSLPSLASAINASVRERVESEPEDEHRLRMDGIRALERLFKQADGRDSLRTLSDVNVLLPNQVGAFVPAGTLYFGRGFGRSGLLCQELYGFAGESAFVGAPAFFGWDDDDEDAAQFLQWLGVAALPRKAAVQIQPYEESAFFEHLIVHLTFPLKFGDHTASTLAEIRSWAGYALRSAVSFDRLADILAHADPHAVLAWIAVDDRIEALRRDGDRSAVFEARPTWRHDARRLTGQTIPSYAVWMIESTEWVPVEPELTRVSPHRCISAATGAKELQKVFPAPAIDPEHRILDQLAVDARLLRSGLERAGVRPSATDFTWEEFYRLLLDLPRVDPEGTAAARVYGMVLEKAGGPDPTSPSFGEFLQRGELWSSLAGDVKYRPREDVYYLGSRLAPGALREVLPVLTLPPTYAPGRAEARLGLTVVRHDDLEVVVDDYALSPQAERFRREAEELKFFVAAYRFSANSESRGLPRLRDIEIRLCSAIAGRARLADVEVQIELLEEGAYVIEGNHAYVLYRGALPERPFEVPELAASIADVFSALLDVQEQTTYMLLANYPPAQRAAVLSQLIGRDIEPVLADMRTRLPDLQRPAPPRQRRLVPEPPLSEEPPETPSEPRMPQETTTVGVEPPSRDAPEQVTPVTDEAPGLKHSKPLDFRVKATPGAIFQPGREGRWTVDPRDGEQLAEKFEEAQGRFPLRVGHLQGQHTLHCDILSFRTEEDRGRFAETLEHDLIERVIEVKSSTSERGEVTLSGDLARTAMEYGDRFFLYRIWLAGGGAYKLVEVQNPMAYDWPKAYRVNPFLEGRARHWDLRPSEATPGAEQTKSREPPASEPTAPASTSAARNSE